MLISQFQKLHTESLDVDCSKNPDREPIALRFKINHVDEVCLYLSVNDAIAVCDKLGFAIQDYNRRVHHPEPSVEGA